MQHTHRRFLEMLLARHLDTLSTKRAYLSRFLLHNRDDAVKLFPRFLEDCTIPSKTSRSFFTPDREQAFVRNSSKTESCRRTRGTPRAIVSSNHHNGQKIAKIRCFVGVVSTATASPSPPLPSLPAKNNIQIRNSFTHVASTLNALLELSPCLT